MPAPPYSSGTMIPRNPSSPMARNVSTGTWCSRFQRAALGAISPCANSRASVWISRWVSVRSGLAVLIRSAPGSSRFSPSSPAGRVAVGAPDLAEHVAQLADGGPRTRRPPPAVASRSRRRSHAARSARDGRGVRPPRRGPRARRARARSAAARPRGRRGGSSGSSSPSSTWRVDADDRRARRARPRAGRRRRVGDLALRVALLDGARRCRPARRSARCSRRASRLHLVGELLDEVAAAERIGRRRPRPDSSAMICCVRSASVADSSVGSA